MTATKYTVTITVQVLSMDSVPALLMEAAESMGNENVDGKAGKADGDSIEWDTESKVVTI